MRVFLTGTAGFIGFHLVQCLLKKGYEVISVDNINDYYDVDLKYQRLKILGFCQTEVEDGKLTVSKKDAGHCFVKMDINDRKKMKALFATYSFDAIFHLAAQAGVRYSLENPCAYVDDNIGAFINILEGARNQKVRHLVYASSSSVYGLNQNYPYQTDQSTEHPASLYAATKKSNEMMAHAYSHLFQIPTTGLRFFTVYGPWGRPDMAPMLFLKSLLNNEPITVFNHGNMYRDFTYIDTVIEGCCSVLEKPPNISLSYDFIKPRTNQSSAPFAIYNIGGEQTVKLIEFIETLENIVGVKSKRIYKKAPAGDVIHTEASMTDFIENFGQLNVVGLKDGLSNFVKWYQGFIANKLVLTGGDLDE